MLNSRNNRLLTIGCQFCFMWYNYSCFICSCSKSCLTYICKVGGAYGIVGMAYCRLSEKSFWQVFNSVALFLVMLHIHENSFYNHFPSIIQSGILPRSGNFSSSNVKHAQYTEFALSLHCIWFYHSLFFVCRNCLMCYCMPGSGVVRGCS